MLPAVWPAFVVVAIAVGLERLVWPGTLLAVVLLAVAAGVLYVALFFAVAIGRRDRALYTAKAMELLRAR